MANHIDDIKREIRAAVLRASDERASRGSEGVNMTQEIDAVVALARTYMFDEVREVFDAMPIMERVWFAIGEA